MEYWTHFLKHQTYPKLAIFKIIKKLQKSAFENVIYPSKKTEQLAFYLLAKIS